MLGEDLVVDAVVHPYNLAANNQIPEALDQIEAVYSFHLQCSGTENPEFVLSREEFFTDFDPDALSRAVFAESPVDLAIIHSLPNLGFTKEGLTDPERMAALRDRYPNRYLLYATVDSPITDTAIKQLEYQVKHLGARGLKLYPSFYYDGIAQCWRLDDADFATPLLEAAQDLGIQNVAVHKAIPVPPASPDCFRVEDLDGALERFSSLNIHVVHAGVAFLPETSRLMARHNNVYANLESSISYILTKPDRFAEMLGTLLLAGGAERILFGSGANLVHPLPVLRAFAEFEMPRDLVEQRGFPEMNEAIRAKILGLNALRVHGLDEQQIRNQIEDDEFESIKAEGFASPWSSLRDDLASRGQR